MKSTVLLVSTATRWLGTARMPRVLAKAGFEVALIAPKGSLALHSRFVSRRALLSETAIAMEVLHTLIGAVDDVSPRMLIPCDEMAVRLLFALMLDPPEGLSPDVARRLQDLIGISLGDPRHFAVSIDKTLLPAAADAIGIHMPACAVARNIDEAVVFADARGYPVVIKRRFGFAGHGVAIVSSRQALEDGIRRLMRPDPLDLAGQETPQILVQSFVAGRHVSQALVAMEGATLGGFAWERLMATDSVPGQTTVLRAIDSPETRHAAEKLCQAFGMAGFLNMQFIVDEKTGVAHLLEINRRIVTHTHLGERFGADLPAALFDRLTGRSSAGRSTAFAETKPIVVFPREWLNDPESPHLHEYPVDVPWDEPELFAALVRMWDERIASPVAGEG